MPDRNGITAADKDFRAQFLANRKRRRRRRWIGFLAVVAAVGGTYYWLNYQKQQVPEDQKLIVEIGYGNIENVIPAAGTLQPKEVVPIGARASGELVEILIEVGDYVEKGDVVARIDAREQDLRVKNSELSLENQTNQIEQRENAVVNAEANYNRTKALHEADASTDQELENAYNSFLSAQTNLANLRNQIQQSETSLEQERVQLDYTNVTAPMDGTIISLDKKEGATLNASQTAPTIMQIADLTTLSVETEISEADIQALRTGVEVYFMTLGSGDRRWNGTLRQIDPMGKVSNNVVLFTGRFDVDNSDRELYPNMTTQVFFVTSHAENVLTVPLGALTFTDGGPAGRARRAVPAAAGSSDAAGPAGSSSDAAGLDLADSIALNEPRNATVQLVRPDDSIETRAVVVGAMDRVNAEVLSGLQAGDRVVAGIIQAKVEEEEEQQDSGFRPPSGGFPGGGFPGGGRGRF